MDTVIRLFVFLVAGFFLDGGLLIGAAAVAARDLRIVDHNNYKILANDPNADAYAFRLYEQWVAKYRKFSNSFEEMQARFMIFKDNLEYIEMRNKQSPRSYQLSLNKFADQTYEEFKRTHLQRYYRSREIEPLKSIKIPTSQSNFRYQNVTNIPKSVDWRAKGAITEVKDQGNCGSCWAFSSIAAVEAINQIATGELISLSEQELLDCDRARNRGCHGGFMDYAFQFIISNGGVDTEEDYPYREADGMCDSNKKNSLVVSIDGYEDVPESNEQALLKSVANQPVSVAIDAGGRDFQFYSGGVLTRGSCGVELNHGVLVVGYGNDKKLGKDYWILKNSWGADWGEKGYMRLQRGVNEPEGLCGINLEPSYPTKTSSNPPRPPPQPVPPPPAPVEPDTLCDEDFSCPASSTCCCLFSYHNLCFAWGCCPSVSATCCADNLHCCPLDYPICDLNAGTCRISEKNPISTKLLKRMTASRKRYSEDKSTDENATVEEAEADLIAQQ